MKKLFFVFLLFDCLSASERVWPIFSFEVGPIYWRAQENGLPYTIESEETGNAGNDRHIQRNVKNIPSTKDWGCKAGINLLFPAMDCWDISLEGLYFHAKASAQTRINTDSNTLNSIKDLSLIWINFDNGFFPQSDAINFAKGQWNLLIRLADLEIRKEFPIFEKFKLRAHAGVREADILQRFHVFYGGQSTSQFYQSDIHMKNNFSGMGLKMGLDAFWMFVKQFAIYSSASFSMLYGKFVIAHRENRFFHTTVPFQNTGSITQANHYHNNVALADLFLGLQWQSSFMCDKWSAFVKVGWEQRFLFGQNQLMRFITVGSEGNVEGSFLSNQGDLTLQGFSLAAGLGF